MDMTPGLLQLQGRKGTGKVRDASSPEGSQREANSLIHSEGDTQTSEMRKLGFPREESVRGLK